MTSRRIVVLGTVACDAFAGMAWMTMQLVVGLRRLGHDVYYFEVTSAWPYDPVRGHIVDDSDYAVPYLRWLLERFGLSDRWAYRRSYSDNAWLGMSERRALDLLTTADIVLNVSGSTRLSQEGLRVRRLVLFATDPSGVEIAYTRNLGRTRAFVDEHDDVVTYGENIGTPRCKLPPLPRLRAVTRQPVLTDFWDAGAPARPHFTTVSNWLQSGKDVEFDGEMYRWSKHHEFRKFIEAPRVARRPLELATNLSGLEDPEDGAATQYAAFSVPSDARQDLLRNGWELVDATGFSTDPWAYREYIRGSAGEFTVARDLNVRLQSGWFSERSACYLAAGRPVITQDTGFGSVLPTGEGLHAFSTPEDVSVAFDRIATDYEREARAAREIAHEYFRAETVLTRMLSDLGL